MNYLDMIKGATLPKVSNMFIAGDAVSGTTALLNRLATAGQIVGFAGGILMLVGCFGIMQWAGESLRAKVKTHLVWVIIGIVGLFAAGALATFFKAYSQGSF
ncbi:hypothetical protein R4B61_07555 (plasmid) [Fructilactobacillus vespulae]|uniref:hypothetical protein n=1 Tax=Fructilactobacillus vespulae TaxID=1249630 RepID=UPI0039B64EE2